MTTTELIASPAAGRPTFGEMIAEIAPLAGAVAAPYLLIVRLRSVQTRRAAATDRAAQLVPRVAA